MNAARVVYDLLTCTCYNLRYISLIDGMMPNSKQDSMPMLAWDLKDKVP